MKLDIFNWIVVCKWTGGACDRDSVGLGELLMEAGATLWPDCTSLWFWFLIELYASFGFLLSAVVVGTIIEIQLSKVEKRHCNYNWLYGFSYPKALIDYSLIRILWETVDTASVFICEMFLFILRLNFNSIWISNIYSQFNCSSFKHFAHRFMRLSLATMEKRFKCVFPFDSNSIRNTFNINHQNKMEQRKTNDV